MTKEITTAEIQFIKDRYPNLCSISIPVDNNEPILFISTRALDPTKIKITRRRLNPNRKVVVIDDNDSCFYCSCRVFTNGSCEAIANPRAIRTRDHIIPKCDGGMNTVTACSYCNSIRGADPIEVFIEFLKTSPIYEGRMRAYRVFKRELMLEAIHARNKSESKGFEFSAKPRGKYTLKDLKMGK